MSTHARQAYLEGEVLHADPVELIRILYRAAIECVDAAAAAIHGKAIEEKTKQISKAQLILNELSLAVDHEKGGSLAKNLVELYDYSLYCLQDANFRCDAGPLDEVRKVLTSLLTAWQDCPAPGALPVSMLPTIPVTEGYESRSFTY